MAILDSKEHDRKRKRGGGEELPPGAAEAPPPWTTEKEGRIYASKLVVALRRLRGGGVAESRHAVRDAANRALAVAARGRTRWSRAVLFGVRPRRIKARCRVRSAAARPPQPRKPYRTAAPQAAVERKARVLSRLVPGCKQLELAVLLEEAADYIAALEMQVRAMAALAGVLSFSGSGGGDTPADRLGWLV